MAYGTPSTMDTLFDILQTMGLGAGVGAGSPLAALFVSVLARADAGLDFEGTNWAFLEEPLFMAALVVAMVLMVLGLRAERSKPNAATAEWPLVYGVAPVIFAALHGAGSMADRGHSEIAGAAIGAVCGALGWVATVGLLNRVRKRLDPDAATALPGYGQGAGSIAAGLSILFPPLGVLVVLGAAVLLAGGKRRAGEKYAGLRILR
jgi:energy-converting hydrogenase Eha subunit A